VNLSDIRAGLETNLAAVDGVHVYAEWPDSPQFPAVCIVSGDPYVEPHQTFNVSHITIVNLVVAVIVSGMADVARAQRNLDDLLSYSLPNAVTTDITLGGESETVVWVETSGMRQINIGGVAYLGHEMSVQVHARHGSS
jgi:hypothetical protein